MHQKIPDFCLEFFCPGEGIDFALISRHHIITLVIPLEHFNNLINEIKLAFSSSHTPHRRGRAKPDGRPVDRTRHKPRPPCLNQAQATDEPATSSVLEQILAAAKRDTPS